MKRPYKQSRGRRILILFLSLLLCLSLLPAQAHAADSVGYIEDFQGIEGETKYIGDRYRSNYYLDIERTGLLEAGDKIINDIANVLFSIIRFFGELVVTVFYFSMDFDLAALFSDQLDSIQAALKVGVFDALIYIGIAFAMWTMLKQLARQNLTGMLSQFAQVIAIIVLSSLVVTHSGTALSYATRITKEVSVTVLMNVNGQENVSVSSYAANGSAFIWKNLIHEPWLMLEFGETVPGESDIEQFLTTPPGTPEREALVSDYMDAHSGSGVFAKNQGGSRLGFLFVYLFLFLAKSLVFLFVALFQLGYQVMAVFYVILAPLILILSLFPSMGGLDMVATWLKKILETQIMILIITFILGLILALDSLLYSLAPQLGWLVVLLLEAVISIFVLLNHKGIFKGMRRINRAVQNPRLAQRQFRYAGNLVETVGTGTKSLRRTGRDAARIGGNVAQTISSMPPIVRIKELAKEAAEPPTGGTASEPEGGSTSPPAQSSGSSRRTAPPAARRQTPPRPATVPKNGAGRGTGGQGAASGTQGAAAPQPATVPPQAQVLPKPTGKRDMVVEPVIPQRPATTAPNVVTERFLPQTETGKAAAPGTASTARPELKPAAAPPARPVTTSKPTAPTAAAARAAKPTAPATAAQAGKPPSPARTAPAAAHSTSKPERPAAPAPAPAPVAKAGPPPRPVTIPPRRPESIGPEIDLSRREKPSTEPARGPEIDLNERKGLFRRRKS